MTADREIDRILNYMKMRMKEFKEVKEIEVDNHIVETTSTMRQSIKTLLKRY